MRNYILIILVLLTSTIGVQAQNLSWRKHRKLAKEYFEKGDYALAAENYEKAWLKKKKKEELIFQAAESYYLIKDFRKAAECYQYVKNDDEDYPLVGLKYARSLKQDGQYDKAKKQFQEFISGYSGQSKTILSDIVATEIEGCELAKTLPEQARSDAEVLYPEGNINTEANEFGPSPGQNNELFFSSDRGNRARVYSSFKQANLWTRASIPSNFPVIQNGHYGNGMMAPDGSRFYFTICNDDKPYNDQSSRCEIFVIKRNTGGWTVPERLPDYINLEGFSNTHPNVAHIDGREYLYFSSNRTKGSRGGYDIYYVTRELTRDNVEYTFPINVGPVVNTVGDEITPYYDFEGNRLYFASNGHVSIGGFDIFAAAGNEQGWSTPENMGLPFNSGADDYGYIENQAKTGGYFVSNRVFGGQKTNTRHTDVFEFTIEGRALTVKGNVYDRESGSTVDNMEVSLYLIEGNGSRRLVKQRNFTDGSYAFAVDANQAYEVEVVSPGYLNGAFQFSTTDTDSPTYGQPVFLLAGTAVEEPAQEETLSFEDIPNTENTMDEPQEPAMNPSNREEETFEPTFTDVESEPASPIATPSDGNAYTARPKSKADKYEYSSQAPRYEGTYFKIQLAAVSKYNPNDPNLAKLLDTGRIDTEDIMERGLTRILLADFFSKQDAQSALATAKASGFKKAFIVRYEEGTRVGMVK
ncbi:MAG: hypothetical protein AAF798_09940 [Bacteroidota bacterium]